jgi:hypothetical protein
MCCCYLAFGRESLVHFKKKKSNYETFWLVYLEIKSQSYAQSTLEPPNSSKPVVFAKRRQDSQ